VARIESPDLASPRFKANPYPFYARLRADAPVYRITLAYWAPVWLVTRYDDALTVLKDERFAQRIRPVVPLTIIAHLLGVPAQDRRCFYSWSRGVAAATSGAVFDLLRAQPALWLSMRYLRGLIAC
jgi:cytochrome P450